MVLLLYVLITLIFKTLIYYDNSYCVQSLLYISLNNCIYELMFLKKKLHVCFYISLSS